jgi:hypothetical protein
MYHASLGLGWHHYNKAIVNCMLHIIILQCISNHNILGIWLFLIDYIQLCYVG